MRDIYEVLRKASISDKGVTLSAEEVLRVMDDIDTRVALQRLSEDIYEERTARGDKGE